MRRRGQALKRKIGKHRELDFWAQCDLCQKWRKLPLGKEVDL
jgi:hypothetical protein